MPLLNDENYPGVLHFLRKMDINLRDDNGRRILPDIVNLFELHFSKTEEDYTYMVCYLFLKQKRYHFSGYSNFYGNSDPILPQSFSFGIHQRVCLPFQAAVMDI